MNIKCTHLEGVNFLGRIEKNKRIYKTIFIFNKKELRGKN